MESSFLKVIKSRNPDKSYPSNTGQKWTDGEEILLLEELEENINIDLIAQRHDRTIGGINCRRKEIAYKLYNNNISIEEIINKTKLSDNQIKEIIKKKNKIKNNEFLEENKKDILIESEYLEIKNDIDEIKNEINEIKNILKNIMMKVF
jgi:hypothetical protein